MMSNLRPAARSLTLLSTLSSRISHPVSRLGLRFAANSVTNRPGSQTIEHAAINVREEFGNSASDLAKTIAGGVLNADAVKPLKPEAGTSLG